MVKRAVRLPGVLEMAGFPRWLVAWLVQVCAGVPLWGGVWLTPRSPACPLTRGSALVLDRSPVSVSLGQALVLPPCGEGTGSPCTNCHLSFSRFSLGSRLSNRVLLLGVNSNCEGVCAGQ